jgi:pilus assembly protein CpaB
VFALIPLSLRWLRMRRRPVSAALITFALVLGASNVVGRHERVVDVLVARHDIASGQVLTASDLDLIPYPSRHAPATAVSSVESLLGRVVIGPVAQREVITTTRVVSARSSEGLAVPVRLADAGMAALLRPGDIIDVLASAASAGTPAAVVADRLRVVTVPTANASGLGQGGLIVVSADARRAAMLAGAAESHLTVVIHPN